MTRKWTSLLLISVIALALPTLASAQYASKIPPPVEDKPFLVRLKELPGKIMNQQTGPDLVKRDAEDKQDGVWRLTDDNYHELVEGDGSSPETVWVVVIHEDQQSIMSKSFKESHANATKLYRDSLIAAPVETKVEEGEVQYKLPSDVRFARVDYITEWKLNTKWLVFKPPYLVFITEKGRDIRFLGPASPPNGEIMWDLIQSGRWQQWIPYEGLGFLQRPIDWYLVIGDLIGDRLSKIPGFVWLMISGAVGKGLMSLMHGDGETVRTTTTTVKEKIPAGATGAKTKEEKKKQ